MQQPAAITVYTPEAAVLKPGKMFRDMWADLRASRELAFLLAKRDISAQYRGSFIGYLWAFITPLVNTATWVFLNASGVVKVADTGIPYPVYVFTGTMLWQVLVQAIQNPKSQVGSAMAMIGKLNFPREAVILSGILKMLYTTSVRLVILVPAILLFGVVPDWHLALFPLALLSLVMVGISIGLFITPLGLLLPDVGKIIPMVLQFAMYLTPVVFAMPASGAMRTVFEANILTPLILTARAWLTGGESPMLAYFIGVNVGAVFLLLMGWIVFRVTMPAIIERKS